MLVQQFNFKGYLKYYADIKIDVPNVFSIISLIYII